jgi:arginyl-tRNA synthetase
MYALEEFKKEAGALIEKACGEKAVFIKPPGGMGDIGTAIAFDLAKKLKKKPPEIAREIAGKIKLPEKTPIAKVEANGPYVNFFANDRFLKRVMEEALEKNYGSGEKKKEKVLIEHTSVNPSGPVHVGRFRNPIIGDALARLHRFLGYDVTVQN